jgi:tRNA U34 5-methylaminomethyl-2-thiouridine-forming methyltransferase MnmC
MEGLEREIIPTKDGSHTVAIPELGITYHSSHGAIQESVHVFIRAGLRVSFHQFPEGTIHIFEMGFGTGLNAFLTVLEAVANDRNIFYTAVEQYPLFPAQIDQLNYSGTLGNRELFQQLHAAKWDKEADLTPSFRLHKLHTDLLGVTLPQDHFHAIYFDAFSPAAQPQLWTEAIFRMLFHALKTGGLLTTYCSKSVVRKAMMAAGFSVQKIPGPPGKREMVQAFKH